MAVCEQSLDIGVLQALHQALEEDFDDVLSLYKKKTPELIEAIRTALVDSDFSSAIIAVHTIKGSSSNLGLVRLVELCREYEDYLRNVNVSGGAGNSPLFDQIVDEYTRVQCLLDDYSG